MKDGSNVMKRSWVMITGIALAVMLSTTAIANVPDEAMSRSSALPAVAADGAHFADYYLAVVATAACSRAATGADVEVIPHEESGGFAFRLRGGQNVSEAHNDCRSEHLDGIEIASLDRRDRPVGDAFSAQLRELQVCIDRHDFEPASATADEREKLLRECDG